MSLPTEERLRRGRGVRLHLIVGLFTLMVLIAVNALVTRAYPWWLWVLTAWLPLIAGHTAWAKGMFDRNKRHRNNEGS